MSNSSGYKEQQKLSLIQLLSEAPYFIASLLSAIFSGTMLLYVDLMDDLGYMVRNAMVILLSRKLTKDLRFEYNYGVGKIEAISSLVCDGIVLFGMIVTMCLSIYSLGYPSKPSDILIAVVGLKLYDLMWDLAFFLKQRKILQEHRSALSETNYAAAFGALLFDCVTVFSLLIIWLLRNHPLGSYVSPIVSIFVAVYLSVGCVRRMKVSLDELTDKTLPEEQQLKILSILTRYYNKYSQFHSIDSRKGGDVTRVDVHLSFEDDTKVKEVIDLKNQMQDEFDSEFGNSIFNIIMQEE